MTAVRFLFALFFTLLLFSAEAAWCARAPEVVRIGVLAKRGRQVSVARWNPTADYLQRRLPGLRFRIERQTAD